MSVRASRPAEREIIPAALRETLQTIGRLAEEAGGAAPAVVGGCVRDWLLGRRGTADVDIAVEGDAISIAAAVARALRGRVDAEHRQFGTAEVRLPGNRRVDFAMYRNEHYARPADYPRVEPGALSDDLRRRDFTINAMAVSIAPSTFGRLIDPFRGREDLQRRLLRALHRRSFLDDPSRILRGIRFMVRFGLQWEAETLAWVRDAAAQGALGRLNPGRMSKELALMTEEPDPKACLKLLAELL